MSNRNKFKYTKDDVRSLTIIRKRPKNKSAATVGDRKGRKNEKADDDS